MRILIAEDEPISRRLLQRSLEQLGHDVVAVADGTTAASALLHPDGPLFAILDWMMPGVDGLAVCRLVRQRSTPYVYVIVLTAKQRREDMVAALDAGVDDFLTKPFDPLELRVRVQSGKRVLDFQEELLQAQARLRRQATHDHLTGLWNRAMALEQLGLELQRAERDDRPLSVVMADLDGLKRVNDTYGHLTGDDVLRETAQRIRSVIRGHDGAARYGGDEFLLLLPGCDDAAANDAAERARAAVAAPLIAGDGQLMPITLSLGIASTLSASADANELLHWADAALYRAKTSGRNRVAR
jgi:diguanylate cyclase (GGDEF)-like protein